MSKFIVKINRNVLPTGTHAVNLDYCSGNYHGGMEIVSYEGTAFETMPSVLSINLFQHPVTYLLN